MTMAPAVAEAQIYAWRDGAGNLVLSDKPEDPLRQDVRGRGGSEGGVGGSLREHGRRIPGHEASHDQSDGLRRRDCGSCVEERAESEFRPSGHPGGVRLQPASGFPQGRDGPDAVDAATAAEYGVLDAFNPMENIRAGVAYLKSLLVRYDHDESLALAAYNAGPGAVEKYGRSVPPYRETRNYVAKIRAASSNGATRPPNRVFKTVQMVDGREVVRYTNKPADGAQVVKGTDRQ